MAKLPEKTRQIAQVHAQLINSVVMACHNNAILPQLEPVLQAAQSNGWTELVKRIRKILAGTRNSNILIGLDEEDAAIILAILVAIQDATQLPKVVDKSEAAMAAPGLAMMIHAASNGDPQALSTLAGMAQQMSQTPGMRQFALMLKPLLDGERDLGVLTKNLDEQAKLLMESLLEELLKLNNKSE